MDWNTVFGSALVSSGIAGGALYWAKKNIDRIIDLRFAKRREETAARIQEAARRSAIRYDLEADVLRRAVSLSYRLRNGVRELLAELEAGRVPDDARVVRIQSLGEELDNLRFEAKAVLPESVFAPFHKMCNLAIVASLLIENHRVRILNFDDTKRRFAQLYDEFDAFFGSMVSIAHTRLDVERAESIALSE